MLPDENFHFSSTGRLYVRKSYLFVNELRYLNKKKRNLSLFTKKITTGTVFWL